MLTFPEFKGTPILTMESNIDPSAKEIISEKLDAVKVGDGYLSATVISAETKKPVKDVQIFFSGLNERFRTNKPGAPCYLTKFRDSCHLNSFTYAANGRCPERPASVTTTHKSRFVITPSNGWTAIRNAILASLARYRALRLSELPCRLSGTKNHHFAIAPFP